MGAKSLAVAQHILTRQKSKADTVTPMQLVKLTYIAHGMTLGLLGRALLDEQVEAWKYGPVVRSVYDAVSEYGSSPIETVVPHEFYFAYEGFLNSQEKNIIDYVSDTYGNIPAFTLSDATHAEGTPWYVTMQRVGGYYPCIPDDEIEIFYKNNVINKKHNRL